MNNRIDTLFSEKEDSSKVTSLFITAGYPESESTSELIVGLAQNGADMIELGMPYSDPLADGPTIQYSSYIALENDVTIDQIFAMVQQAREESQIPIVLMGYINPILQYGIDRFCSKAQAVGVDGLIVPDLPPEESALLEEHAANHQLQLIFLVAPNTTDQRMQLIDEKSKGFVYCVSVTGVTGARQGDEVSSSVDRFIGRVQKNITHNPVLVGFGIKSHEDAMQVADGTDGFIVGSALIDIIKGSYPGDGWKEKTFNFVHQLKYGQAN